MTKQYNEIHRALCLVYSLSPLSGTQLQELRHVQQITGATCSPQHYVAAAQSQALAFRTALEEHLKLTVNEGFLCWNNAFHSRNIQCLPVWWRIINTVQLTIISQKLLWLLLKVPTQKVQVVTKVINTALFRFIVQHDWTQVQKIHVCRDLWGKQSMLTILHTFQNDVKIFEMFDKQNIEV